MRSLVLPVALLCAALSLAAGCAKKDAGTTPAGTAASSTGTTATGITAAATPTPEQEAARQRAIQQGPGIEAANEAARQGK